MRRLKLFLAILGFSLAAGGIALNNQPLVWAAMGVLAAALGIRFWLRRRE
jgi:Flp pilus assembly protein TadB